MSGPASVIGLGRSESVRLTAYGVLLLFLGLGIFSAVSDVDTSTARSLLLLLAFVLTIVVHELLHGLCFWLFGGSPRFGVGISFLLPYLYTTSAGHRFNARQMSVIGLAPLIVISVATLATASLWPAQAPYALVGFLTNLSGSLGDVWLVALIRRFARLEQVSFEDRATGVAIWTTDPEAAQVNETIKQNATTTTRFATRFLAATLTILVVTIIVGLYASFALPEDQAFRIGPAAFPLFEKLSSDGGLAFSLSLIPPVVGGLAFAGLSILLWQRPADDDKEPTS